MDIELITKKFKRIGARAKFANPPDGQFNRTASGASTLRLNIETDKKGEFFSLSCHGKTNNSSVEVIDVRPSERHLLLLFRQRNTETSGNLKSKFLCGHDERHWFVAGIPESAPVGTVRQAMEALQPQAVRHAIDRQQVSNKDRIKRKNAAFVRQGEWFFLPVKNLLVEESQVLHNEPLSRGIGSKPHWAEYCFRRGGQVVWVCRIHPQGVSTKRHRKILQTNPKANTWGWYQMRRNPTVYIHGKVRHPDHATINLQGWHQVVMNTENQSQAMRHVAFLD